MTIAEKIDYLLARLDEQEKRNHDLEHDLPHIHTADIDASQETTISCHGTAGTYETSRIRDEVARLADIVRDLANLCDRRAENADRTARRQSAVLNGTDPDV
jgi:hypothetical protein